MTCTCNIVSVRLVDKIDGLSRHYTLKLLAETNVCNGAAKQVSAGVAPCNMVGFVKRF